MDKKQNTIAIFISISCVLQIVESLIPHPVPGIRLGLSSVMTLIALVSLGFGPAMEIAVLRTLVSSIIMGTFMSPTFILSFAGAVVSTSVMGLLYSTSSYTRVSIIGISVLGAIAHNMVQLYLAYFIMIKNTGIFVFWPWLCAGAVVMGWITGIVAANVCKKLSFVFMSFPGLTGESSLSDGTSLDTPLKPALECPGRGPEYDGKNWIRPDIKILAVASFAIIVFISTNPIIFLSLSSLLAILIFFSRIPLKLLFNRLKIYSSLVIFSFFIPLILGHGDGLANAAIYSARILLMIMANSLLMATTTQEELVTGLSKVLSPLQLFGVPTKRISFLLSLSLNSVPVFMNRAKRVIRESNFTKTVKISAIIPMLSNLIIALYVEAAHPRRCLNN